MEAASPDEIKCAYSIFKQTKTASFKILSQVHDHFVIIVNVMCLPQLPRRCRSDARYLLRTVMSENKNRPFPCYLHFISNFDSLLFLCVFAHHLSFPGFYYWKDIVQYPQYKIQSLDPFLGQFNSIPIPKTYFHFLLASSHQEEEMVRWLSEL